MKTNINRNTQYWNVHKEIYNEELDSLDAEIIDVIINKPNSGTAFRFNSKIDKMVSDILQESND